MERDDEEECTEEEIDPRVKDELEALNAASGEINKLETEIDKARQKFRMLLSESSSSLNQMHKKLGKAVDKARSYHEQLKITKQAEAELQKATVAFQRSNSHYSAAKETVELAEQRMMEKRKEDEGPEFNMAWQEMMNHATMKFMDAEQERTKSEQSHQISAAEYSKAQRQLQYLEKDMPRSIKRAKPYFDLKDHLETRLQQERQSVEDLQRALLAAKELYRSALANLENISEEIHASRQLRAGPRTPGVGAESDVDGAIGGANYEDSLSINLDVQSLKSDSTFLDDADVASLSSYDAGAILNSHLTDNSHPLACSEVKTTVSVSPSMKRKPTNQQSAKRSRSPLVHPEFAQTKGAIPKTHPLAPKPANTHNKDAIKTGENSIKSETETDGTISLDDTLRNSPDSSPEMSQSRDQTSQVISYSGQTSKDENASSSPRRSHQVVTTLTRGRPSARDKRPHKTTPMQFPMLQGLMETSKRMSPKLPENRIISRAPVGNHKPAPVQKNAEGFFEYPVPSKDTLIGVAKEVENGEDLFIEDDVNKGKETPETQNQRMQHSKKETPNKDEVTSNKNENNVENDTDSSVSENSVIEIKIAPKIEKCDIVAAVEPIESRDTSDNCDVIIEKDNCDPNNSQRGLGEGCESSEKLADCVEIDQEKSDIKITPDVTSLDDTLTDNLKGDEYVDVVALV